MRRRSAGVAVLAALSVGLSGCWLQPGWDARRAGNNPVESTLTAASVGRLAMAWSMPVGNAPVSDPAVSEQGVHVAVGLTATTRQLGDGSERWSVSLGSDPLAVTSGSVSVRDGKVLVPVNVYKNFATGNGVHAYDIQTGAGGEIVAPKAGASVTVSGSMLSSAVNEFFGSCIGCTISHLYVTDLADPAKSWFTDLDVGSSQPVTSTAVGGDHIFLGRNTQVDAFTVTKPAACPEPSPNQPFCAPVWSRALGGPPTVPVLSEDARTVYVSASGALWALDAGDGTVLWKADLGGVSVAPPTLGGGQLYATTNGGTVLAFDARGCGAPTCTALWAGSTGSRISTQAALAGGVLYLGSDDGSIHAYKADGCGAMLCAPRWSTSTGSRITGAPAVALGYLVVGTQDGRLIAYRAT